MNGLRALNAFYNKSYNKRPILTLCITNGILGIVSDSLAQSISLYDRYDKYNKKLEQLALPQHIKEHQDLWAKETKWNFTRTLRFATYNFCVAPLGGKWYMFLDKFFPMPIVKQGVSKVVQQQVARQANIMTVKRMVTDQGLFAPAGLILFFSVMGLAETGKIETVKEKLNDTFMPALIANYKIWPAVQFINFKYMPLQYRLPFVSSLGILWNAYLSWLNNASRLEEDVMQYIETKDTGLEVVHSV